MPWSTYFSSTPSPDPIRGWYAAFCEEGSLYVRTAFNTTALEQAIGRHQHRTHSRACVLPSPSRQTPLSASYNSQDGCIVHLVVSPLLRRQLPPPPPATWPSLRGHLFTVPRPIAGRVVSKINEWFLTLPKKAPTTGFPTGLLNVDKTGSVQFQDTVERSPLRKVPPIGCLFVWGVVG